MKKHHKKTKHRRKQKHNNSKRTRKNRAGTTTGMIHGEHHAPRVETKVYNSQKLKNLLGTQGFNEERKKPFSKHFGYYYDEYDTEKPTFRDRILIDPKTVIPRTLPNSQILGHISIIDMKTKKPINTFIRQNQKLIEVKKLLSVQPEIDCPPEYLYFGVKKRFCGPEYWKAALRWLVAPNSRYIESIITYSKTQMKNNVLRNRDKWTRLVNIISQKQYYNCSVNKNRLDTPGQNFILLVFRHKMHNKQWTPEGIAKYILELNERIEPLEADMLLKQLGISRMDKHATRKLKDFNALEREFNSMPQRTTQQVRQKRMTKTRWIHLSKKKKTLDRINNFTLQKFIKDYDMSPYFFELFVPPVVSIQIDFSIIAGLSETLPPNPIYSGRFSVICKFGEVYNEADNTLGLSTEHGIDVEKLQYHPTSPVENKQAEYRKAQIDNYYKYQVMKKMNVSREKAYNEILYMAAYFK